MNRRSEKLDQSKARSSIRDLRIAEAGHRKMGLPSSWNRIWFGSLILITATLIAYLPTIPGKFLWDDGEWTFGISGLLRDFSGLRLMWCKPTALQQYYPLAGTSFWLDYHLWGFRTWPYHIENILLHAFSAVLFWVLLRRLLVPGAWLAGAVFALHPVMVESAGWITERKNVLSLVLFLGALLAYGRFTGFWKEDNSPAASPAHRWRAYSLAFFLCLGALLAKTTAFSFPAVVLLVCWWKRGHIRWRADVLPSLPFFAVAIGLSMLTAWLEKNHVRAEGPEFAIPFADRCLIAGRALWFYTGKVLWPSNLCFVYPRWQLDPTSLKQWMYPAAAAGMLIVLWLARGRLGRGPAAAGFFFTGTLFPVLGFMNTYFMRYSFVCDHWVYVSSLGLIALGAALVAHVAEHFRTPIVVYGFAAVVLPVLTSLTWRQGMMYTDVETLWRTTIARNPDSFMPHNSLGSVLLDKGQLDEAICHFQTALEIKPDYPEAKCNLGVALLRKGQVDEAMVFLQKALETLPDSAAVNNNLGRAFLLKGQADEAIAYFQKALEIQPDYARAHYNLALVFLQKGHVDQAIAHYQKALEIEPDLAPVHNGLGMALMQKGKVDQAIAHYQKALEIEPDLALAHNNLGMALLQKGRVNEAVAHFKRAVQIDPKSADTHSKLGDILLRSGRADEAIAHYQRTLEIQPQNSGVLNNLAWILATALDASLRNGAKAVELAQQADRLSGSKDPEIMDTLAAAYAEAGRFPEAVATAERALQMAASQNNASLVNSLRVQTALYRAGCPFRDTSLTNTQSAAR